MEYSISEFAKRVSLTSYTLRYYEQEGLLQAQRKPGGQRVYREADLNWVEFIKRLKETGMTIKEIRIYADYRTQGKTTLQARLDILVRHRQHILNEILRWQEHLCNMDRKINFYETALNKPVV